VAAQAGAGVICVFLSNGKDRSLRQLLHWIEYTLQELPKAAIF